MTFYKYPSIENSYQDEFIEKIRNRAYDKEKYMVTEKIHGSNTQITYDVFNKCITYGKRTGDIVPGRDNDGADFLFDILEPYRDRVIQLSEYIAKSHEAFRGTEILDVTVYGEAFGGTYPHKDVELDKKAQRIQKHVYYTPHNEWAAFDIGFTAKGVTDRRLFMSPFLFRQLADKFNIPTAPILKITDSLDEALEYPTDGLSVVYKNYGLPPIEGNIMEGVVIKPYFKDFWIGAHRIILKNKNDKFTEKKPGIKVEVKKEIHENVLAAIDEVSKYINENRVNSALSKIPGATIKDTGRIIGMVSKDVLSDYIKDGGGIYSTLEKKDQSLVTKAMNRAVAKVVNTVMRENVEPPSSDFH